MTTWLSENRQRIIQTVTLSKRPPKLAVGDTLRVQEGELDRVQNGVSKREAMKKLGGDASRIAEARRAKDSFHAYLELHIEQGGKLDRAGVPIGVVEGIVTIDDFDVHIRGFANHAGTTPMAERRDALVAASQVAFPAIPGVASPRSVPAARQNDRPIPLLVPQVDGDGNERAGVRTPEITVPMATYTGWNFRGASIGGPNLLVSLMGSAIPFAPTKAAKAAADPRRSIEERYPSQAAYTSAVQSAADTLVAGGYLLKDDVTQVLKRAAEQWSYATSRTPTSTAASR
jgi:hypothetical protein